MLQVTNRHHRQIVLTKPPLVNGRRSSQVPVAIALLGCAAGGGLGWALWFGLAWPIGSAAVRPATPWDRRPTAPPHRGTLPQPGACMMVRTGVCELDESVWAPVARQVNAWILAHAGHDLGWFVFIGLCGLGGGASPGTPTKHPGRHVDCLGGSGGRRDGRPPTSRRGGDSGLVAGRRAAHRQGDGPAAGHGWRGAGQAEPDP